MESTCQPGAMKNDVELVCTTVKVMRSKFKKCFDIVTRNITSYDLEKYNCEGAKNYKPDGQGTSLLTTQKACVISIMDDVCEKGSTDNYDEYVAVFTEIVQVSKVLKPGMHAPKLNITFSD